MATHDIDASLLDQVIKKIVDTVESSRQKVFEIAESARHEENVLRLELENLKREVALIIEETDSWDKKYRMLRRRLAEVSSNFRQYSEENIREAYEQAAQAQLRLTLAREREQSLRNRRDELEIRLRRLEETVNKADNLMSQIGVIIGYLRGDLARFNEALEKAQHHQLLRLQIIQAQEEERKRVARDIHDGPAQLLANVMIRSEIVERMLKSERYEEARKELATMKDMVRNSLSDVRKIIFDLRPMALDDLGLVPTLRKYMKDIEERTTLTVELKTYGEVVRLPSTLEVAVFRLVQECLSNAIKHAKARTVKVSLEFARNVLLVVVKDDGIGFIPEQTQKGAHYGILGMKERITLLSGTMQIHSAPGNGTTVYFRIPLKDEWVKKGDRATV